jgi:hypothetical protein
MNAKKPKRTQMTLRLPPELLKDMDREAARAGLTRNAYILHLHNFVGRKTEHFRGVVFRKLKHSRWVKSSDATPPKQGARKE